MQVEDATHRPRRALCSLLLAALMALGVNPAAQAGLDAGITLIVRDARSGMAVAEPIWRLDGRRLELPRLDTGPRWWLPVADGLAELELEAPGYQRLQTRIDLSSPGRTWVFWLQPEAEAEAEPLAGPVEGRSEWALRVLDADTLLPLAGVRVALPALGLVTLSDADGRAWLSAPAPADPLGRARLDLELEAGGARRLVWQGLPWQPGRLELHVDLPQGASTQGFVHGLDDGAALDRLGAEPTADCAPSESRSTDPGAPPASIRVGFADAGCTQTCCSVASCTHTCVMPLEEYVRRGLWREWIASWAQDSLRAGAVPYRSYGAWHVFNPRHSTHDICSSACCQVSGTGTNSNTNLATAATAGILLQRNGQVFRAEYSAQNNAWRHPDSTLSCTNHDLSCGNGVVGSPAANWPCLLDQVALNRSCHGHGRGMSQWGTRYWQTDHGRRWPWMVDHYYNALGQGSGLRTATMTSPLRISAVNHRPTAVPGDRIQLRMDAANLAGEPHAAVLIGASLRSPATGFVSDPANDALVTMPVGAQNLARDFQLPATLPTGAYEVWVSLYLDIDSNAAINTGDLVMALNVTPAALLLVDDRLFADGFGP